MRYGICTGLENLGLLEKLGYDYIELSVTGTMGLEPDVLQSYEEQLKSSRVKCEVFNVLFPQTMELIDGTACEEITEYLHKAMSLIQSFGAEVVVFGSGKCRRCPEHLTFREAYEKLIHVYRLTGEIASQYGIKVVIEPLSRSETNMINTIQEGAMLEFDVNRENVALLADFYHVMANHDSLTDMEVIRHFGHIHIASENGRRYPLSEEGEEYAALMKELKLIGYDGRISIEGKTDNMEEDARTALALLKELESQA